MIKVSVTIPISRIYSNGTNNDRKNNKNAILGTDDYDMDHDANYDNEDDDFATVIESLIRLSTFFSGIFSTDSMKQIFFR